MRLASILKRLSTRPKHLLFQYAYGHEHESLLAMTRKTHTDYCDRHGVEYLVAGSPAERGRSPHWRKVELLAEALQAGYDLFDASGYGIAVGEYWDSPFEVRHLNTGFLLVTKSPPVMTFFRD